jgi:hypothetical protein
MSCFRIFKPTLILLCILTAGCATTYGPRGLTGGYGEEMIDESTYVVNFSGNGYTDGDTVWKYWIYRCAELTRSKGFTAFTLIPVEKKSALIEEPVQKSNYYHEANLPPQFIKTKGGFIYMPGQTITTYGAKAMVKMYSQPYPDNVRFLIDPEKIIETLKPYVESGGKAATPARVDILKKAVLAPESYI